MNTPTNQAPAVEHANEPLSARYIREQVAKDMAPAYAAFAPPPSHKEANGQMNKEPSADGQDSAPSGAGG